MRPFLFPILLCLATVLAVPSPAQSAPSPINPKLAKSYEAVAKDMSDDSLNLEHAAAVVRDLLETDGDNAFAHYAAARLAAWSEKWDEVLAEIEAGNKAPYAIQYQRVDGPGQILPMNATIRQLARAVSQGGTKMDPEKAFPLLNTFRTLTRKVAWSEPRSALSVLVAAATRSIARNGLFTLQTPGSPEAAEAQKNLDTDRAFAKKMSDDASKVFVEDLSQTLTKIAANHKITLEQIQAYHTGGKVTPAVRVRILAVKKDLAAIERPWTARWLKQLPE